MKPRRRAQRKESDLDPVWKALANPARRRMLDILAKGPLTTGELADEFTGLTRFTVMQHMKVLEKSELLVIQWKGRKRFNYLNPVPIQQIYDRWVSRYMQPWTEALISLKDQLESEPRKRRTQK